MLTFLTRMLFFGFLCVEISFATSLHQFIDATRDVLESSRREFGREWTKYTPKRYNITDTLTVQQRTIHLSGFCLKTRTLKQYMQIFTFGMTNVLSLAVHYGQHESPINTRFHALLFDISAEATNRKLSGTEMMLLVQYILKGLGVKSCRLNNCATIRYAYQSKIRHEYHFDAHESVLNAFVPLIYLRCIRGKTNDWYSEFGYFNARKTEIEDEMVRIHDTPYRNTSFGPWLLALWNQEDKRDFHFAYQANIWRFSPLRWLRDGSTWIAYFH